MSMLITDRENPEDIADVLVSRGVKNLIIKLGSRRSYLRKEGQTKGNIYPPFYIENPVECN